MTLASLLQEIACGQIGAKPFLEAMLTLDRFQSQGQTSFETWLGDDFIKQSQGLSQCLENSQIVCVLLIDK